MAPKIVQDGRSRRFIDMAGQRFGRWLAVSLDRKEAKGSYWRCRCDCGNEAVVFASSLRAGDSQSCGCLRDEAGSKNAHDISGRRFGRLVALSPARGEKDELRWLCRCDCGTEKTIMPHCLVGGETVSCGCHRRENGGVKQRTHSGTGTPEYKTWHGMIARTENSRLHCWANYGGRGIRVCRRWRTDFAAFRDDMGPKPSSDHSIDRIDNAKGYDCGICDDCRSRGASPNCQWQTRRKQAQNRRSSRVLTFGGETLPLTVWAERSGLPAVTIMVRVRAGWPEGKILTTPVKPRKKPDAGDAALVSRLAEAIAPLLAGRSEGSVQRLLLAACRQAGLRS